MGCVRRMSGFKNPNIRHKNKAIVHEIVGKIKVLSILFSVYYTNFSGNVEKGKIDTEASTPGTENTGVLQ